MQTLRTRTATVPAQDARRRGLSYGGARSRGLAYGGARRGLTHGAGARRRGLTVVEIVIALSVLVVAASLFGQLLVSTTRLRRSNREAVVAAEAARIVIEQMRNGTFSEIYVRYNQDPADDPGGAGTAPGNRFRVEGLDPLASSPGGLQGVITFPDKQVTTGGSKGGKLGGVGGGGGGGTSWQIREDTEDAGLGCPRDLNGNNVVDTANHSSDYLVLPVRVQVEWDGVGGERRIEIVTQFADFLREDDG